MSFISVEFIVLFISSLVLYYTVPAKFKKIVLLLGSSVFIGYYHISFLVIAFAITMLTYFAGQKIASAKSKPNKEVWLYSSIVILLVLIWLVLRYPAFLENIANTLFSATGLSWHLGEHSLLFPIGISFYTFQAVSYLTEIHWDEIEPEHNVIDFSIYMLFFMKFLSGPIERPDGLLAQIKEDKPFNYETVSYGLKLFFIGLFKKVLIADHLGPGIDGIYNTLSDVSGAQLLVTCLVYPIQLYADFSGYTDMALGGAFMFGYKLIQNFDRPFISTTTTELWRRWHISLSSWVRDYVYMPLTAIARSWGKSGISIALLISFVTIGVWHGASWNFAIYGLIQGLIVVYEMNTSGFRNKMSATFGKSYSVFSIVLTYLLFALSLVFFRADSLNDAWYFLSHISFQINSSIKELRIDLPEHVCIVAGLSFFILLIFEYFNAKNDLIKKTTSLPVATRWAIYYILVLTLFSLGTFGHDSFVYIQF